MEKFYSCEQVAERYKVKVTTVWGWIREKTLPAVKIVNLHRVTETDLEVFELRNRTTTSQ